MIHPVKVIRQMALYLNKTDHRIELGIGRLPGSPWDRYDSNPGDVIEGPAAPGYREILERSGYTLVTAEEAEAAKVDAALMAQITAEEAAKVDAALMAQITAEEAAKVALKPVVEAPKPAPEKVIPRGINRSTKV